MSPLRYALALAALAAALAPVYWLVTIALKQEIDQFAQPPVWFGFTPTIEHFRAAFASGLFGTYFRNSVIAAAGSTAAALLLGIPAAYGLARLRWPGSRGARGGGDARR